MNVDPQNELTALKRMLEVRNARIETLQELAYAPDGKEHRSVVFEQAARIETLEVAPTPAMVAAGINACDGQLHAATVRKVYAAMIAASVPQQLKDATK